jgi:hypothetical protein
MIYNGYASSVPARVSVFTCHLKIGPPEKAVFVSLAWKNGRFNRQDLQRRSLSDWDRLDWTEWLGI